MSILSKIREIIASKSADRDQKEQLDKQLKGTFPSSDPLGVTHPDHGTTGPEVARREDAPPIRTTRP